MFLIQPYPAYIPASTVLRRTSWYYLVPASTISYQLVLPVPASTTQYYLAPAITDQHYSEPTRIT